MTKSQNEELYLRLRKNFPVFNYEAFSLNITEDELIIEFNFNINGKYHFSPVTKIKTGSLVENLPGRVEQIRPLLENIAFNIGMIELISYWKAACPPIIRIMPARLTSGQSEWWKKLYFNGLGEFFYLNSIHVDQSDFIEIESVGNQEFSKQSFLSENKYLIPIGGGKDSAVTLSLLKMNGETFIPLIMNPRGATVETIKAAGLTMNNTLVIERVIEPGLLELNKQGFLNGHTPFSAMLAFYTLMCSALTGFRNVALSNEGSANESTIPGTGINHQYSKSLEFETDFRTYYGNYISEGFNYFSLLRPLSELQIAKIFSELPQYHDVFRSCNAGSKTDTWCGKCPKCLFTYIMLSAFKGVDYAGRIIGRPMLDDPALDQTFNELTGYAETKPFDCVGTTLEVKQALQMIVNQHNNKPLPRLLAQYTGRTAEQIIEPDFALLEETHFVPASLINLIKKKLQ